METIRSTITKMTGANSDHLHIFRLRGCIQEYEWGQLGSKSLVAKLAREAVGPDCKIDPEKTYAEVWMGTHESGPATLFSSQSTSLASLIKINTSHYLGSALLQKWPGTTEVPFLFKILSIQKALPLQAHPDKELAEILHRRDSKEFVDSNHKPEIAVAIGGEVDPLSPNIISADTERIAFTGFVGFQPVEQIAESLKNIPELRAAIADDNLIQSFTGTPSKELLKDIYSRLLTRGTKDPDSVKQQVEKLVKRVASSGWGSVADEATAVKSKLLAKVNEQYPGDVGVLAVPFFMNLVRLKKGEAIYIGADEIHAYLEGDIIECMAVSDNVVNSAFVPPEERDIKTFTDMLTYTSREPTHWTLPVSKFTRSITGMTVAYSPPLEEFDVLRTQLPGGKVERIAPALGPTIGIVTSGGAVKFSAANEELELPEGGIVYVVPGKEVSIEAATEEDTEVWWASYSS